MDSSFSPKDELWFLRVCHHISNAVYHIGNTSAKQFSYDIDQEICMTHSSAVLWCTLPTSVSTLSNTIHASLYSHVHSGNNLQCRNENVWFVMKKFKHKLTHHRQFKTFDALYIRGILFVSPSTAGLLERRSVSARAYHGSFRALEHPVVSPQNHISEESVRHSNHHRLPSTEVYLFLFLVCLTTCCVADGYYCCVVHIHSFFLFLQDCVMSCM